MTLTDTEKTCPLCGNPNNCMHGSSDCWCNHVKIPRELIERIPEEKRRKACICKNCVDNYLKDLVK